MEFNDELIEMVKQNEILYNKRKVAYRNVAEKAEVWESISQTIGQPVSDCISKWKNLRDRFTKLSNHRRSQPSGSEFKPEWKYYKSLSFLYDHIKPRKTANNHRASSRSSNPLNCESTQSSYFNPETILVDEKYSIIEEETGSSGEVGFITQKPATKRKIDLHNEMADNIASTITVLQQLLNRSTTTSNFSQSVDILLTRLSADNRSKAEAKIMEYLCKCQLEDLKNGDVANVQM